MAGRPQRCRREAPRARIRRRRFLLSVQWGRSGRGARAFIPPPFSPGWWLQPGL
jgi:hypothetical protein